MMRAARALAALTALSLVTALSGASAPTPAAARPAARRDWSKSYSTTPQGGFRMGKPSAKIALVEYGSLTCPHCRHFAQTAMKPLLQNYVRSGKVSYEYRSFVLNGFDLSATLMARCGGPARFFPMAESLYASQPVWLGRAQKLTDAELKRLDGLAPGDTMVAIAKAIGILPVAAANGIAPARAEQCLRDGAAAAKLTEMYRSAMNAGVAGTPAFFVNGKQVKAIDWATLEPQLKLALGGRG